MSTSNMNRDEGELIRAHQRQFKLSPMEMQVLQLLANGKHADEIAAELGTTKGTIDSCSHRIKNKLGANTSAGAVGFALRRGLIK